MKGLTVVAHPLAEHYLSILRGKDTESREFRHALEVITSLLVYEATRTLEVAPCKVNTPLMQTRGAKLKRPVLLAPILRAGLGMLDAALRMLPEARVGFIGLKRDERTLEPVSYCRSLPAKLGAFDVILLDPMLATGGSALAALETLTERGARRVRMVNLLVAPEGVRRVTRKFPEVSIVTASLDKRLNDRGYILPGLGDAGDRLFGA